MKKLFVTCVILSLVTSLFAQSYIRVNVGYALPMNAELIGEEGNYVNDSQGTGEESGSVKGVYGSLGSGVTLNLAYGNTFKNGTLGYDVEAGFLIGKKYSMESTSDDGVFILSYKRNYKSTSFQICPSVTFTSNIGKFHPYSRIGPVIAITSIKAGDNIDDFIIAESKLSGGVGFGFKGVLGANFTPIKKIQFFSEIAFTALSYSPTEGELTKFIWDGEDILDTVPPEERKTDFEKEYSYTGHPDDVEGKALQEKYSMGSLAIQVGLRFRLK